MADDLQYERTARELRQQIGRLRRRIDGRLRAAGRETRRLTSWRTYVKRFPGCAVLTALGTGLILSAGLSAHRIARWLGLHWWAGPSIRPDARSGGNWGKSGPSRPPIRIRPNPAEATMAAPKTPLLKDLKDAVGPLGGDLREMAALRWQLALLELKADAAAVKRLAVVLTISAAMGLCGLSLLAVFAADVLDGLCGLSHTGWLLLLGSALLLGAAAAGYAAWRRFRRRFTGLEQSLAEVREDLVWLRECLENRPFCW